MSDLYPRQPATPASGDDWPTLEMAPPPGTFTPPATPGYPLGGLVWSVDPNMDSHEGTTVDGRFYWLKCTGQLTLTVLFPELAARVGNVWEATFGAATPTTFRLPDLRARFPLAESAGHLFATIGGEETHVLSTAELPAGAIVNAGAGNYASGANPIGPGGAQAHNNMPPFITLAAFVRALP